MSQNNSHLVVSEELSSRIKLFCIIKNIKMKDFVKYICDRCPEFQEFQKGYRKFS